MSQESEKRTYDWTTMTPREKDALVAEKVMGLRVVTMDWPCGWDPDSGSYEANRFPDEDWFGDWPFTDRGPVYLYGDHWPPQDGYAEVEPVPFYTTNIAAAWEVVEKMTDEWPDFGLICNSDGIWSVTWGFDGYGWYSVAAPTAPEAICLAALRAKGVDV